MFLGTHAVIQTVAEKLFGLRGKDGTTFYLKNFLDGDKPDQKFSTIAEEIHDMRNVKAHQWSSAASHDLAFDYTMPEGWKRNGTTLHINPRVFRELFLAGFGLGGKIWTYRDLLAPETALVQKYRFLRDWLDLAKSDPIAVEIRKLEDATTAADRSAAEASIKTLVVNTYGL